MGAAPMSLELHGWGTHVVSLRHGWCQSRWSDSCVPHAVRPRRQGVSHCPERGGFCALALPHRRDGRAHRARHPRSSPCG